MKPFKTLSGDTVTLSRFKEWWQVRVTNDSTSYTVYQSKSRTLAASYIAQCYHMPAANANLGTWMVDQRHGRVIRNISIYP